MLTNTSRAVMARGPWRALASRNVWSMVERRTLTETAAALPQSSSSHLLASSVFGQQRMMMPLAGGCRRSFMSQGNNNNKTEEGKEKAAEGGAAAAEGAGAEAAAAGAAGDENSKLITKLQEENKALKDKVLYTLAEMENVRTIARRDMENSKQFAIQSFAKQLLDVADNLSRAIDSVPKEALEKKEDNAYLATLVEGVQMTDVQLQKIFGANKIVKYAMPGDKFDPHLHDALFEYEDPGKEAGSVGQVLKTGYKLNDRVIRPAQVGTVKKA